MKVWLDNQLFKTNEELMDGVNNWLGTLAAPFCDEGLQKLVRRYDKCLNLGKWKSNAVMYVSCVCNKFFFSIFDFFYQPIGG
jgi:hypothetical protein